VVLLSTFVAAAATAQTTATEIPPFSVIATLADFPDNPPDSGARGISVS
jgi:hypothetical protein